MSATKTVRNQPPFKENQFKWKWSEITFLCWESRKISRRIAFEFTEQNMLCIVLKRKVWSSSRNLLFEALIFQFYFHGLMGINSFKGKSCKFRPLFCCCEANSHLKTFSQPVKFNTFYFIHFRHKNWLQHLRDKGKDTLTSDGFEKRRKARNGSLKVGTSDLCGAAV